jgi:hypothetical protein
MESRLVRPGAEVQALRCRTTTRKHFSVKSCPINKAGRAIAAPEYTESSFNSPDSSSG